jgi:hypothetical protein
MPIMAESNIKCRGGRRSSHGADVDNLPGLD